MPYVAHFKIEMLLTLWSLVCTDPLRSDLAAKASFVVHIACKAALAPGSTYSTGAAATVEK